jgi:hypothetical protein
MGAYIGPSHEQSMRVPDGHSHITDQASIACPLRDVRDAFVPQRCLKNLSRLCVRLPV